MIRRKILFTNGMSDDFLLIITEAPKEDIEKYCMYHNKMTEDGIGFEPFDTIKAAYYVKELLDSEIDEKEDVDIIGYDEAYDFSDYITTNQKKEGFRTIKLFGGMTGEYEIISTNAPDSVIKAQLTYTSSCAESGEQIENPYLVIESMGYTVEVLGSHEDFSEEELEETNIDAEFDFYQF